MSLGSQIIYKQLFDRHGRIRVPMIQRDYAQGRSTETEVREEFLNALETALRKPANDPMLPLNLDFIYGSVEGADETQFLPLDGQQRLTTLFLLHWYLAWRDEQWDVFEDLFQAEHRSRFAYSVRPSSNEFFDEFVRYRPDVCPEDVSELAQRISDQPWYFRNWRLDPTIQSVLHMLDAIHKRFSSSTGLFSRLTDAAQPAITFQLLDLENFGLSDDLYIKMNARGKPLTPFETFKARYEQELKKQFEGTYFPIGEQRLSAADYVALRLDTKWADLFWKLRDKKSNLYDGALMNVFRAIALATRAPDNSEYLNDVSNLRNVSKPPSYSDFHSRGWLDERFTLATIHLLDAWSTESKKLSTLLPDSCYFDEAAIFDKIILNGASLSYAEIVQFTAYVIFVVEHHGAIDATAFQEWMRIVFNLSINTEYNRPSDMQRSIAELLKLTPYASVILEHFANSDNPVAGFNQQQIMEERLKAQLLVNRSDWRPLIDRAEGHDYFQGQIEFLLDFCGLLETASTTGIMSLDDDADVELQVRFDDYLKKAEAMFNSKGLTTLSTFRWERALLCIGDYLLPSRRNHSFLVNLQADQATWKRLLRGTGTYESRPRKVLCELWERLNGVQNISTQLDEIIDGAENLETWREAFVRTPAAIGYCHRRLIRRGDYGEVYLLQTTQMNGKHAELFTYCLYENMRATLKNNGYLNPLTQLVYQTVVDTDTEPGISLFFNYDNNELRFEIEFNFGKFDIYISCDQVKPFPLIEAMLVDSLSFVKGQTSFGKSSTLELIESSVREMAEKLATTPRPKQI
jgi:hypothetical protein